MKKLLTAAIVSTFGVWSLSAQAANTTTTFGVSASVSDSCEVSASALDFGTINVMADTNTDATTTIDVTCSNGTSYDIGLDAGTATGASVTTRQMTDGGSNTLNYSLYSESSHTTNWGDTVDTDTVSDTGSGSAQTHTVYGRVPSGQTSAVVGSYSDTITVTVTY